MSHTPTVCNLAISGNQEELKAFQEAIKDSETRKEIISILEEAGLLHGSHRQPA